MRKCCYFFRYEGAVEGKNVEKKKKKKEKRKKPRFWIRDIFVKGSNMENIATIAGTEN